MRDGTRQIDPRIVRYLEENGLDTVAGAFAWEGGQDMVKPGLGNRRRTRIYFCDPEKHCWQLFMKRYYPRPTINRLVSFVFGSGRVSEAAAEYRNIRFLREAGVPTMREIMFGEDGGWLGPLRSYLIVSSVPGDALERCGQEFMDRHAGNPEAVDTLTDELITLAVGLHKTGFVHRDFYASHIFLHEHEGILELYLIDLARAFRPRARLFRWRVKDLSQLKYSMPVQWVSSKWNHFISGYLDRMDYDNHERWNAAIDARVTGMERRKHSRA